MAHVAGTSGNDFIHVAGDGLTPPGGYNDITGTTSGDDVVHAGAGDDIIYTGGGSDRIHGDSGNDTIIFSYGISVNPADVIDGGGGNDTLVIQSSSDTRAIYNITNIETLKFEGTYSNSLQLNDTAVAAGRTLILDASAETNGVINLNGSAETDGHLRFIVGGLETAAFGGAQSDTFVATSGLYEIFLNGDDGNDVSFFGANFTQGGPLSQPSNPNVNGGNGYDIVRLHGDYTAETTLNASGGAYIENVEELRFASGFNYRLAAADAAVAAGNTLTVSGAGLGAGNFMLWDGSAERDGTYVLLGGAGADTLIGGALNDTVDGHAGDDLLNLAAGGVDTVAGGNGNDRIDFGAALTAADHVNGGSGTDELILNGDYSAGITLGASTITSMEVITLEHGFSYALTENDTNVADGATLTVDGSALGAANSLTFDGSAESRGHFVLLGGVGSDTLTGGAASDTFDGGAGNDVINMQQGGNDTADGGGGNDVFNLGAVLHASDHIDGGSGSDTLNIDGDYSARTFFNGDTFSDIETLHLTGGNDYYLVLSNGNVLAGQVMTVDASDLGAGDTLRLIADSLTFGRLDIIGGDGDDHIAGGNALNTFFGGLGADLMKGGAGRDTYVYTSVAESTSTTHDIIQNLDPTERDAIQLPFVPTAYLGEIDGGSLSQATFDADLATLANASALPVGDAAVFAPTSGDDAGRFYLVIDANGVAGYQSGQDYVIQLGVGSSDLTINFR